MVFRACAMWHGDHSYASSSNSVLQKMSTLWIQYCASVLTIQKARKWSNIAAKYPCIGSRKKMILQKNHLDPWGCVLWIHGFVYLQSHELKKTQFLNFSVWAEMGPMVGPWFGEDPTSKSWGFMGIHASDPCFCTTAKPCSRECIISVV